MGAKRVVVEKNKSKKNKSEKKKKKSCCLTCFLVFIITTVVILAALVGVGCYFGNMYSTQYLDMTIGECFSVVSGLYAPNEKKIVTNAYSDEDLDAFYTDLKHAVFLKEDTKIDVEEIFKLVSEGTENMALNAAEGDKENNDDNAIMTFLTGLFTKENIDFDRLKGYEEAKHDDYLLKINDKGLAAFASELLNVVLKDGELLKTEGFDPTEYGLEDLSKYIKLRQAILGKEEREVTLTSDSGATSKDTREVTMLTLTVQVKLMDAAKLVIEKFVGKSILSSIAHFGAKVLLPNNIYLTVGMGLDYETDLDIKINRIDDEKKVALTYKLIDGIMDSGEPIKDTISNMLHESVYPQLEQVTATADLSNLKDGTLYIDPFATVIDMAGINEGKEPDKRVTSKELLAVVSDLLGSEWKNAVDPVHTYKNQYKGTAIDTQYNEKYGTIYDPTVKDETKLVDYEDEFLKEVAEKYLIDLDPDGAAGSGDEIEFADFMAMFGIGDGSESKSFMELIDRNKISGLLDKKFEDIQVKINDRMMGAIISATLKDILKESDFGKYDIEVEQVIISSKQVATGDRRQFIEIGLSAGISSMTGDLGEAMLAAMMEAFLPERIMLSLKLDVTRDLGDKQHEKTEIRYNDLTEKETERMLKVVGKFVESLETDSILEQVEKPIREMLDNMYTVLPSVRLEDSALVLPDIFTTVSEMMFTDDKGEQVVSGEQIQDMLSGLVGSDEEDYVASLGVDEPAVNYEKFVEQINSRYYIKSSEKADTFDDIFKLVDMTDFDASKFDLETMRHDGRAAEELSPVISDGELARIFAEAISKNNEDGGELENMLDIAGIHVGENKEGKRYIRLVIGFKLVGFGEEIESILPVEKIYIVADSLVDEVEGSGSDRYYKTSIGVNKMTEEEVETLQKMMNHLQGKDAIDLKSQAREIGKSIFTQFNTLSTSLGEDGFEFVSGGLKLTDFYSFLTKVAEVEGKESETVKAAVQGLFEKRKDDDTDYNFTRSDIVTNEVSDPFILSVDNFADNLEIMPTLENGFKAQMSDKKFGATLAGKFESENVGTLKELTIVSKQSSATKTKKYYDEMKLLGVEDPDGKNYMRLVVEVDLVKLMGDNSSGIKDVLSDSTLITIYIALDGKEMRYEAMRINSLEPESQAVLMDIAHFDESSVQSTINDALDIVKEYHENAQYVDSSTDGVGAIYTDIASLRSDSEPIASPTSIAA